MRESQKQHESQTSEQRQAASAKDKRDAGGSKSTLKSAGSGAEAGDTGGSFLGTSQAAGAHGSGRAQLNPTLEVLSNDSNKHDEGHTTKAGKVAAANSANTGDGDATSGSSAMSSSSSGRGGGGGMSGGHFLSTQSMQKQLASLAQLHQSKGGLTIQQLAQVLNIPVEPSTTELLENLNMQLLLATAAKQAQQKEKEAPAGSADVPSTTWPHAGEDTPDKRDKLSQSQKGRSGAAGGMMHKPTGGKAEAQSTAATARQNFQKQSSNYASSNMSISDDSNSSLGYEDRKAWKKDDAALPGAGAGGNKNKVTDYLDRHSSSSSRNERAGYSEPTNRDQYAATQAPPVQNPPPSSSMSTRPLPNTGAPPYRHGNW